MRDVVFAINTTADGFCSHTDGIVNDELHAYFTDVLRGADTILFGRTTYELMIPYWPEIARGPVVNETESDFARVFDSLDKVLFSTTLTQVSDPKTRLVRSNLAEEVTALKQKPGKNIGVGSLSLASQLSALGVIDEYHIVVHPVIAGHGPRLFESVTMPESFFLELIGSKTFSTGVTALHYRKRPSHEV